MKLSHTLSPFLVLAAVLACAAADELAALKIVLLNLCTVNTAGTFGDCCVASNNGQDLTAVNALPTCFGSVAVTTDGNIQKLFASNAV